MSNALTLFDQGAVPAHITAFTETHTNVEERETVPSLSYEGKVWSVIVDGQKTQLTRKNEEGDKEPLSIFKGVVLDWARRRGRALYAKRDPESGAISFPNYTAQTVLPPMCWSDDGLNAGIKGSAPFPGWTGKCDGCPMAAKNSKVDSDGKGRVACSQHRMLAVIPQTKALDFRPLRLKIAMTSDWDDNPAQEAEGWFSWSKLVDMMRKKGVTHTASFIIKMKMDPNVAWPKVVFSTDRWLTSDEIAIVAPVTESDEVKGLLAGRYTPAGKDGTLIEDTSPAAKMAEVLRKKAEAEQAVRQAAEEEAAATVIRNAKVAAAKKAEKAPVQMTMDLDDEMGGLREPEKPIVKAAMPKKEIKKAEPKTEAPAVALTGNAALAGLLDGWDA